MTAAARRRELAIRAQRDHEISQRRVCDLVGVDPKTVRREPPPDHAHIPVLPRMAEVLDATSKDQLLIILNVNGRPLTEHRALQIVREWRDKAGLSDTPRLQDARGTAATRLLNAGLGLPQIASFMGWGLRHAQNVIEHYARLAPDESDHIREALTAAKRGGT